MTVGVRIRGSHGNIQIDDETPVFQVVEQGTIGPYVSSGSGHWSGRQLTTFATPVTTQEPPLIFLKISSGYWVMTTFTVIGEPGNWTGFAFGAGQWSQNLNFISPSNTSGVWFSSVKTSVKSTAKVGIRVRNRLTGQVMFDSGFKVVKFIRQDGNFTDRGRLTHWILRYSVGYPAGAYFLANTLSCIMNYFGNSNMQFLNPSVDPDFPGDMLMYTWAASASGPIPYQSNTWNVLFAVPGQ